jgi:glycosyltransferase involved in cell wall biosynthesis
VRLLLVIDSLDIGGAERHAVDLAVALRHARHSVTVACTRDGPLRSLLDAEGVPVRTLMRLPVKRRVSIAYGLRLRTVLGEGFDLVHAHVYASAAAAAIATAGTGIPLVVTEHSEGRWQSDAARMVSRWAHHRAAALIAVSETVRQGLVERGMVPANRIVTIPNGVTPAPTRKRADRRHGPLIGVVARLEPEKGVDVFLETAADVTRAVPESRFLVVGDGSQRGRLQAQADRLELGDRICFLGWRMDAREIIGGLDVLAVPSRSEGMPLATLEAMSAGVPVVATVAGGIPEQIRHGREGLLVPVGDHRALAEACIALLHDPARAGRMGEGGRERVQASFSQVRMVALIEALYCDTLRPSSPPLHGGRGSRIVRC